MKTSNKQKLQLLLISALAFSSITPVVVAGCYWTATGVARYGIDGGWDCTPVETITYDPDGTIEIADDCTGLGCFVMEWPNYYCDGTIDLSPLSCVYCDEEYADVDGYIETGACVSVVEWPFPIDPDNPLNHKHYCTCNVDPNSGTVTPASGVITSTGSDCEMCPERVGS